MSKRSVRAKFVGSGFNEELFRVSGVVFPAPIGLVSVAERPVCIELSRKDAEFLIGSLRDWLDEYKKVPVALSKLQGVRESDGYVDIRYNNKSFQLKSDNKTNPYMHWYDGCKNNASGVTFEKVIEELYKETQRIK